MKLIILVTASFLSLTANGWSGLVMSFDPADLSVTSNGMNQIVDLGILVEWDGAGENTLSGFTLGFSEASPSLEVIQGMGFTSDFTWSIGSGVNATSISGSNAGNHTIDMTGTQLLGTLQFTLDAAFTSGMIPIDLTFTNAQRDIFTPIPPSEVNVTGGILNVSAATVPEPSSLAMLGVTACGALCFRRRRKGFGDDVGGSSHSHAQT